MSNYKSILGLGIFRYTEKFFNIMKNYILILFFFTLLYSTFGYSSDDWNGMENENDNTFFEKIFNRFYFSSITFSTIGYGDISPKTFILKILTIMFAVLIFAYSCTNTCGGDILFHGCCGSSAVVATCIVYVISLSAYLMICSLISLRRSTDELYTKVIKAAE